LEAGIAPEQRSILDLLVDRITVQPDQLSINLNRSTLLARLVGQHSEDFDDSGPASFSVPLSFRRRGVETKLVLGDRDRKAVPDAKLIETVARARDWLDRLADGRATSINDLAAQTKVHPSEVSRRLPLAFLAPDIVEAIVKGRQPPELTAERLMRTTLPKNWERQRRALGFAPGR
jgi:site-specific DNA recombinase